MKKNIYKIALFLVLVILATGCSDITKKPSSPGTETVELFFLSADGKELKSEGRQLEKGNAYSVGRLAVAELIKGPEDKSLKALIPQDTRILGYTLSLTTIKLDLSAEFGGTTKDGMLKVYSVVKTLCGINGIDKVVITVNEKPIKYPNGEEMGAVTPDILKDKLSIDMNANIKLFFINSKLNLVPEQRDVIIKSDADLVEKALNELINGPKIKGNIATMPKGTRIIGMFTKDGIFYLNLSNEFYENREGSELADQATINSIVKTLMQFDNINSVRFYLNGKSLDEYGSVDLRVPIGR